MSVAKPRLIQIPIQFNSIYCGIALNSIELPHSCYCLGLTRDNKLILASDRPKIYCEDTILAVALNSAIAPELASILKKTHPVLWTAFRSHFPRSEAHLVTDDFFTELCCKD
ncbi:MAG: potassium transporter TrkA [Oscillatoriales cyanobacterium RU_3_3]|nr:potassium transporter TrkA [Microcoleus sp. SU_5_6]NJL66316.1 potassium transporter TrkA [Microcoleus sp. SM1_3_4]NJM59469.1 potassium transporter TrkA [Oscillatoriales cyanobacterium RU_3_3]NJR23703.1 potassium transporter TrkA [Richelia sp. CSU_2_1]